MILLPDSMPVLQEIARAQGHERAECYVCLGPFRAYQKLGSKDCEAVGAEIVVHAACVSKPFQREGSAEDIEIARKIMARHLMGQAL